MSSPSSSSSSSHQHTQRDRVKKKFFPLLSRTKDEGKSQSRPFLLLRKRRKLTGIGSGFLSVRIGRSYTGPPFHIGLTSKPWGERVRLSVAFLSSFRFFYLFFRHRDLLLGLPSFPPSYVCSGSLARSLDLAFSLSLSLAAEEISTPANCRITNGKKDFNLAARNKKLHELLMKSEESFSKPPANIFIRTLAF